MIRLTLHRVRRPTSTSEPLNSFTAIRTRTIRREEQDCHRSVVVSLLKAVQMGTRSVPTDSCPVRGRLGRHVPRREIARHPVHIWSDKAYTQSCSKAECEPLGHYRVIARHLVDPGPR